MGEPSESGAKPSVWAEGGPSTSERTPLLHPGSVIAHHRLAPPAIRFPQQSVRPGFAQQGSYGFPSPERHRHGKSAIRDSDGDGDVDAEAVAGDSDSQRTLISVRQARQSRWQPKREDSKVYTSFPRPANSPWDGASPSDEEPAGTGRGFFARFFAPASHHHHHQQIDSVGGKGYHQPPAAAYDLEQSHPVDRQPGLPKMTRACLWSEIKCYGKHMLPAVLVFVVLVLCIALSIYHAHKH